MLSTASCSGALTFQTLQTKGAVWQKSAETLLWQCSKTACEVNYLEGKHSGQVHVGKQLHILVPARCAASMPQSPALQPRRGSPRCRAEVPRAAVWLLLLAQTELLYPRPVFLYPALIHLKALSFIKCCSRVFLFSVISRRISWRRLFFGCSGCVSGWGS